MRITFLGTGTSQGIPIIGCKCKVCSSNNPLDKRLRSSVLIELDNRNILIDAGPDFRQQMLSENVNYLDAILITHAHHDHISGLDDIRSFNYIQRRPMDIYANENTLNSIKEKYDYVFTSNPYPGVPEMRLNKVSKEKDFFIDDIQITPIEVSHMKMLILGYKIGDFAYITDANSISETELEKLKGVKVLVLNALRKEKHISHFTLEEALNVAEKINPEQVYFTHISHDMGFHHQVQQILPKNRFLAYDHLSIEI